MRTRPRVLRLTSTTLPCLLLLSAGCEEPRHLPNSGKAANQAAPNANTATVQPREILGKTTQDVRKMEPELQAGAQVAPDKITAKDPLTLSGNAYVVSMNHISFNNVKHAIDLYQAEHGEYPKNYEEFRDEILKPGKPDGIALPQLPYYQEYSYDEKEHKLVVLEYPERKAQVQKQDDAKYGR